MSCPPPTAPPSAPSLGRAGRGGSVGFGGLGRSGFPNSNTATPYMYLVSLTQLYQSQSQSRSAFCCASSPYHVLSRFLSHRLCLIAFSFPRLLHIFLVPFMGTRAGPWSRSCSLPNPNLVPTTEYYGGIALSGGWPPERWQRRKALEGDMIRISPQP